ncbi:hydroxyphenylacetyl-CoA thioesterase PaaI [Flexivirga meconopsidis]|uniref:hydroxyphenylacetyl-CoA thioesterase PaaI n=1 Tax=Flexivirga meconopsidis TaxID=2977121 RepID=UPI00223E9E5B|nr:hydroxyphenylacetyl-CoA thioesterase PaaI [Flexivirga meconopsidis]
MSEQLDHVMAMWRSDDASAALGIELLDVGVDDGLGYARTRMTLTARQVNGHNLAHGGFIFALADSTFALACNAPGRPTVASGAEINFVTPGYLGDVLVADAHERTSYGRSGITDVTVRREADGEIVAEFRGRSRSLQS